MRLQRLEEEMHQLQDSAVLFEVVIPEFKYMKACRKELRMLKVTCSDHIHVKMGRYKLEADRFFFHYILRDFLSPQQLWDHICLVRACVDYWKTTPWREVDVENMDIECKKFAKDIRCKKLLLNFKLQLGCLCCALHNLVFMFRKYCVQSFTRQFNCT